MAETKIYEAICNVMADIGVVGKNDVNTTQGFKYRGIDAVMNALNPAMIKHKVFVAPEVIEQQREERLTAKGGTLLFSICKVKFRFFTTDGSSVEVVTIGEGMDSGDKATNKAMSIAFKYACFQLFCIPTEELMDDPDKESQPSSEVAKEKKPGKKQVTEEEKAAEETEKIAKAKIGTVHAKALEARCNNEGVPVELICKLYKVDGLASLTNAQYRNIADHWDKILEQVKK